ncbi:MAG: ABC transporter permease [Candidatus Thermoplasmatota archaeon]|nr:ABC transporter permease [Candidatus Thermoplasmatota archaeon]
MNLTFIKNDLLMSIKQWTRSTGTVFWTILFPILLIMIFGAIFSNVGNIEYDLVVQDLDTSDFSEDFVDILHNISVLNIIEIDGGQDITTYMLDHDKAAALQIPSDFSETLQSYFVDPNASINLTLYTDPTEQTTTGVIQNIILSTLYEYNMGFTHGKTVVFLSQETTLGEDYRFIDFFVPGMIGFTIMTSMIYGSIERNTKYRKDGILRKLLTMPITRADWIVSKMLFMLFLSFISTFVILLVGTVVWGLTIHINLFFFVIIIATSFMFSGLGMIVSRFVKDEEVADMAGGAITFPMMFLAGTFFPLDQMPAFLQSFAQVLPLYYVNEGLRNAMIYADLDKTVHFTLFVLVFAAAFFILGVFLTKWEED